MSTVSSIYTEKRRASPKALAAEEPNPKRMVTSVSVVSVAAGMSDPSPMASLRGGLDGVTMSSLGSGLDDEKQASSDDETDTSSYDGTDDEEENEPCCHDIDEGSLIKRYLHDQCVVNLSKKLSEDVQVSGIVNELLGTLCVDSQNISSARALKHFDKVKEVWGNRRFIEIIRKDKVLTYSMGKLVMSALRRLSSYLMIEIKTNHSCMKILRESGPGNTMSNEDMILPLVCTMGGFAFGVKTKLSVVEEEKSTFASGEKSCDGEVCMESKASAAAAIHELYNDSTLMKLAKELENVPVAVTLAKKYLSSLQGGDCRCYRVKHLNAALTFWLEPVVLQKLVEALKPGSPLSSPLTNILKKYSKGAQFLRCKERMSQIIRDPLLKSMLNDPIHKMSYWGDRDVTKLFRILLEAERMHPEIAEVDYKEEKIEAFVYVTSSIMDLEALKNWLAPKYGINAGELKHLDRKKIGYYLKDKEEAAKLLGYEDGNVAAITIVLKNDTVFSLYLSWHNSRTSTGTLRDRPVELVPVY